MRPLPHLIQGFLLACLTLHPSSSAYGQSSVPRDPRAVAILQQSFAAMGGTVPTDSEAKGTIELVEGSTIETGTIRILTRGLTQTAELIETDQSSRALVHSGGKAREERGRAGDSNRSVHRSTLELEASSRSLCFPLAELAFILSEPDTAFEYVGSEHLGGTQAHRIRVWKTLASKPGKHRLANFTVREFWIDATSGLPIKSSYERRAAGGAELGVPFELRYADYRNVSGILYPFRIERSINGTHWATVLIESVRFSVGLADSDFATRQELP